MRDRFAMAVAVMYQARPQVQIDPAVVQSFELRWRQKMTNARLNGFIQNHYNALLQKGGRRTEGSMSLRDDLYTVTSRNKRQKKST